MEGPYDSPTDNPSGITERFEIEKVLSAGKSTLTYKAQDTVLNEEVTVKTMAPDMVKSENLQLFHNDLKLVSKVEHDSIAKILDYGQTRSGKPYVVLEYLDGICLKDRLKDPDLMPLDSAISIMKYLCEAISLVHMAGVIHRDLKPSNIFLVPVSDQEEIPVVVDFGFGQLRKENEKGIVQSAKGDFAGDPVYMSPEQIEGEKVDLFTDYYSLGCVFYELLNGKPPFVGNSFEETFSMQVNEPIPNFRKFSTKEDVRIKLEEIISILLEKESSNRQISLEEVSSILEVIEEREFKKKKKKSTKAQMKNELSSSFVGTFTKTVVLSVILIASTTYVSHHHSQKQQILDKPISNANFNGSSLIDSYIENKQEKHLKLKFLNISDQDIEKITELENLETLQIGGDKVTKDGLLPLMELENLTEVQIFNPKLVNQADFDELNNLAQRPLFSSETN